MDSPSVRRHVQARARRLAERDGLQWREAMRRAGLEAHRARIQAGRSES